MIVLRCKVCGFLDASTPTTAEDGDECTNCGSETTQSKIISTL